jgi:6,7-dimethyl-8-ribityllumazine synthase
MITSEANKQILNFVTPVKILIVISRYYKDISDNLISGAMKECNKFDTDVHTVEVPGALEIPSAIRIAFRKSNYDGFIALGCVVRGETSHYETVCCDSSRGLMLLGIHGANIGNGILTVENMAQAEERADPKKLNKGGGAAIAMLSLSHFERTIIKKNQDVGFKSSNFRVDGTELDKGIS